MKERGLCTFLAWCSSSASMGPDRGERPLVSERAFGTGMEGGVRGGGARRMSSAWRRVSCPIWAEALKAWPGMRPAERSTLGSWAASMLAMAPHSAHTWGAHPPQNQHGKNESLREKTHILSKMYTVAMTPHSAHPQQNQRGKMRALEKKEKTHFIRNVYSGHDLVSNQILTSCPLHSVTSGNQTLP